MKKCLMVLLMLLITVPVYAASSTCGTDGVNDSCTPAGLASAISSASAGDTINIAQATHSWTSGVTVNKKVTITGGGSLPDGGSADPTATMNFPTQLNISGNTAFYINATSGTLLRISGLHINGNGPQFSYTDGTDTAVIAVQTNNAATYRIDNMYFSQTGTNMTTFKTNNVSTGSYGVIDHVYNYNTGSGNFPRFIQNTEHGGNKGDTAWSQATTWGSSNFVFIEDSTVIFPNPNSSQPALFNDQQGGGRLAARHNYIQNANAGNHGTESGWPARSGVAIEMYDNVFNWTAAGDKLYTAFMWRGGSIYLYNNSFTNYQSMAKLTLFRAGGAPGNSPPAGTSPYDGPGPPAGYPLIDQHGRGQAAGVGIGNSQPQAANKSFIWNNTVVNTGGGGGCSNIGDYSELSMCDPTYIVEGVEYEYSSDATAASVGYTAYTYPHPLTSGATPPQVDTEPDVNSVQVNGSTTPSIAISTSSVTLTATCEDQGSGASTIQAAEYFVATEGVAGAGTAMAATDGTFDEVVEPVTATVTSSAWTTSSSPYVLYVDCQDATVATWGPATAGSVSVTIYDTTPTTNTVQGNGSSSPTLTQGELSFTLTAVCNDVDSGDEAIVAGEYFQATAGTSGTGTAMTAQDGVFNEVTETVTVSVDSSSWIGTDSPYVMYVDCQDASGNWSVADSVSVAVVSGSDTTAPASVTSLNATVGNTRLDLGWVNPTDIDFAGTMVRYGMSSPPANSSAGTLLYNSTGTFYSHQGLTNGTTYYYSAFAYDEVLNYATADTTHAIPVAPPAAGSRIIGK